jgi:hypothetical protein
MVRGIVSLGKLGNDKSNGSAASLKSKKNLAKGVAAIVFILAYVATER